MKNIDQGKKSILDNTCRDTLRYSILTLDDFPDSSEWRKMVEKSEEPVDSWGQFMMLMYNKYNILIENEIDPSPIETKINDKFKTNFTPELVDELIGIAKQKNSNIQKVYILSEVIGDHVYEGKESVLPTLIERVKKNLSLEPIVVPEIEISQIKDGDHIIVDRHNKSIIYGNSKILEQKPTQFTVLPIETELSNNERFLGQKSFKYSNGIVNELRKEFEKKTENDD